MLLYDYVTIWNESDSFIMPAVPIQIVEHAAMSIVIIVVIAVNAEESTYTDRNNTAHQ